MKTLGSTLFALLLVAVSAVGAAIALSSSPPSPEILARSTPEPVLIEPVEFSTELEYPVRVKLSWGEVGTLLWPGRAGTITSVDVAAGQVVESGMPIASVDGVGVIALTTAFPLYRDLGPGDSGADVEMLTQTLVALELLDAERAGDRYTTSVSTAVRELNVRRAVDSNRLDRDGILWLPETFAVASVQLRVGQVAPVRDTEFANGPQTVLGAAIEAPEADPEALPELHAIVAEGLHVLEVGGVEFDLDLDGSVVTAEVLGVGRTSETETIDSALIRLRTPELAFQVPAAAIITSADGSQCVVTPSDGTEFVQIVDGSPGFVVVDMEYRGDIVGNADSLERPITCER